ncbi:MULTISPECIES: hypothetical protein [unclassified Streptomyces]|uniref:hypothetical protein n=1 Tax=unclassified Streptomyces TaxID=2593676 RepID=UPI0015E8042C|nr:MULTISPECIES: hypothetical protein [unclassified Streptomyces]MBJ6646335.1 hypothetical protein [Streptomyces sp. BSE7-9]MCA2203178.1 hypothetical protein [Streptomyces sp. SMS_SU21]
MSTGSSGSGATAGADDAPPAEGVTDGSAVADALGAELDAEGDGDPDALALADGDSDVDADALGEADGASEDGSAEGASGDASGTLALTSSGAAVSRDGVSYENSPLAQPAAPRTATTAPDAAMSAPRRRRFRGAAVPWRGAAGVAAPADTARRGRVVSSKRPRSSAFGCAVPRARGVGRTDVRSSGAGAGAGAPGVAPS